MTSSVKDSKEQGHDDSIVEDKKQLESKETVAECPVNFSKLTLCALRKYQYKFRLQMGPGHKPLLTRDDLLDAISRHFTQEMTVDYNEEIAKFLSFKREETRCDFSFPPTRRQPNRNRGARNAAAAVKPG